MNEVGSFVKTLGLKSLPNWGGLLLCVSFFGPYLFLGLFLPLFGASLKYWQPAAGCCSACPESELGTCSAPSPARRRIRIGGIKQAAERGGRHSSYQSVRYELFRVIGLCPPCPGLVSRLGGARQLATAAGEARSSELTQIRSIQARRKGQLVPPRSSRQQSHSSSWSSNMCVDSSL